MNDGLIIDLFAGGGGASEGIREALGREVDIAVNHDLKALMIHKMNHPEATHIEEDIFKVKLKEYVKNRHVSLMWASPACTEYSRAKGGRPKNDQQRVLPWAVHQHAADIRPDVLVMENVQEIQAWEDYGAFVSSMGELGYTFECRELVAADYGVPTIRKRWYAVLRCDGCKTEWPEQTHAKPGTLESQVMPTWKPVAPHIDFEDTGQSIFDRTKPLAEATMRRIAAGIERFVLSGDPYVVGGNAAFITQFNNNCVGQDVRRPMHTITCSPGHFGLVTAFLVNIGFGERKTQAPRVRSLDLPLTTVCAQGTKQYLCSAFLVSYYGNSHGAQSVREPLPTVTCRDRFGLVTVQIDGDTYELADIHLRMLKPEELKLAQGFPREYIIDRYWGGKRVPKSDQVAKIGNSVAPPMARKIVESNVDA